MLKIKTVLKTDSNNQIGVFAGEAISANQPIWSLNEPFDRLIHQNQLKNKELTEAQQEFIKATAPFDGQYYCVLGDDCRHIQNSTTNANITDSEDLLSMIATRDISKGEELFIDYALAEKKAIQLENPDLLKKEELAQAEKEAKEKLEAAITAIDNQVKIDKVLVDNNLKESKAELDTKAKADKLVENADKAAIDASVKASKIELEAKAKEVKVAIDEKAKTDKANLRAAK